MPGEFLLTYVVRTYDTFENTLGIRNAIIKYSKESCGLTTHKHCAFKYFLKNFLVKRISLKYFGHVWAHLRHEEVRVEFAILSLMLLVANLAITK